MPTPAKPYQVLAAEKKSHRTKAELKQREQEEKALASGMTLEERSEVRENKIAHREFIRVNELLGKIEKNDALYEPIINRYCEIQAECVELKAKEKDFEVMLQEIRATFKNLTCDMDVEERANLLIELTNGLVKITNSMNNIDKLIGTKRKMLFDIEKENIFTIASSLRSIPKKVDGKEDDPLLKVLRGGR